MTSFAAAALRSFPATAARPLASTASPTSKKCAGDSHWSFAWRSSTLS